MFFILSKTLDFLLSPLLWVILIFFSVFFCKKPSAKKKVFLTGIILLLFFSNSFIVNEAFLAWEDKPIQLSGLKKYETAIVLTGVASNRKGITDRVFFGKGADRVLHTVQLYKSGKIQRILISGGSGAVLGVKIAEAGELRKVFLYCGVPDSSIILEEKSRNTTESARFSKKVIDSLKLGKDFLLVTSSFHIPRSIGCFTKAGISVIAYPVDFYSRDRNLDLETILLPSESAIGQWAILMHEIVGYLFYKLMGYS
ncbi:MAG: YdcF family protein [Daejeonella sp.]|uniref:YdcF family protein n=1 Tax=Daejeonella sp. TaxID=2805397 RepID=UPI002735B3CD|nr:YdcF family protein [Daejeonella sp.]MDP3467548.1 YdcF family protein [Daejeonella sp.]